MSKLTKRCRLLSWIVINQSMTVLIFFHWLSCKFSRMFLFILSKLTLPIFPSSFSAGLISLRVGLLWKSSLQSFSDMQQLFSLFVCILFTNLLLRKTYFQAALIFFLTLLLVFLSVAVIESVSILSYSSLVKR